MIPIAAINEWRIHAPWSLDAQVEQDLVLSRVMVEMFNHKQLSSKLSFRGGTALHKLYLNKINRYSEDIDLVQINAEPIGATLGFIQDTLNHWLGKPNVKRSEGRVTVTYHFNSQIKPIVPLRLKIEINTREHFSCLGFVDKDFVVDSQWFHGKAKIRTYLLEELLATKLRALYQRKKGRDLFDFFAVLSERNDLDIDILLNCFEKYMSHLGQRVTKAQFQENLYRKRQSTPFNSDMDVLLPTDIKINYDIDWIYTFLFDNVISQLHGEPWKGLEKQ